MEENEHPETSYILDGLRELMIQRFKPLQLSVDSKKGLAVKEELLSKITHDFLLKNVKNYLEYEAQVALHVKDNYTTFLIQNSV